MIIFGMVSFWVLNRWCTVISNDSMLEEFHLFDEYHTQMAKLSLRMLTNRSVSCYTTLLDDGN